MTPSEKNLLKAASEKSLLKAAQTGDLKALRVALEHGAEVNARDGVM